MQPSIKLSLGALTLASVAAFTLNGEPAPARGARSYFDASLDGAVVAASHGRAEYGAVGGSAGTPAVFTVSLGGPGSAGSILFTRVGGGPLTPGTYPISDGDGENAVRALVTTGTAERPSGAFRADAGVLTITRARDNALSGEFRMRATGFLASAPADEGRRITVSGSFSAAPNAAK